MMTDPVLQRRYTELQKLEGEGVITNQESRELEVLESIFHDNGPEKSPHNPL